MDRDRAKGIIVLLAAIATIVACISGVILGTPPALVALRQLRNESSPTPATVTPRMTVTNPASEVPRASPPTATPRPPTAKTIPPTNTARPPSAITIPLTNTARPPTATTVPPTNTARPPTATTMSPTNVSRSSTIQLSPCAEGNMIGRVANDIPGTKVCLGETVSSVLDEPMRHRDVYAIDLTAGEEVRFTLTSDHGTLYFHLYNLGSKSIESQSYSEAISDGTSSKWVKEFIPAVSGTYFVSLAACRRVTTFRQARL